MKKRMLYILLGAAILLLSGETLFAQRVIPTQELVFPHLAVGGSWETEITIVAQGAENSSGLIFFFDTSGQPLLVSVNGGQPITSAAYSLLNRSSQTFRLTLNSSTRTGYAVLTQAFEGNENFGAINGVLTFRFKEGERVVSQVGVSSGREILGGHLPYDNTNGNLTAIAIASIQGGQIGFNRYDEAGSFLESKTLTFSNGAQRAFFLVDEFPNSNEERGFFIIRADNEFYPLALNVKSDQMSTTALLPAIFERDLRVDWGIIGGIPIVLDYTLRLERDGLFLHGIAQSGSRSLSVTGAVLKVRNKYYLQLNLYDIGRTLFDPEESETTIFLLSDNVNKDLFGTIEGMAIEIFGDDLVAFIGEVALKGTFTMFPSSSIQF